MSVALQNAIRLSTLATSPVPFVAPLPGQRKLRGSMKGVLVSFLPGCSHLAEQFRLVYPAALAPDHRCLGVTVSGARCRRQAASNGWCAAHSPKRLLDGHA